ncbi:LCP family protein [Streptomyces griseus]|uniref:Transcriptional regulator n=1 Tax=Streptomyces griseus subsp. griseus (strain JCM 4626 / CBS 651.72 / NBRC 13350 / KCC S-0626 / ISP 5235) TaxID=455632 RepID=B1VUU3_STRGG|nr:LCP family protein [Streptomyces griseus]MBW3706972.1 LytR family transcriptional regulator [Streptomyces griseus]BAG21319.1 putative transcriptional regulator [Streptomyces griseus subsp. griseus NBRC 13350]SEE68014.1 cell envelope-related function transcriptional attenuator common domain-containing protein [Streptomyces griseus]SQA20923.1 transcriptional regulator [Streptomyces griseus]
MRVATGLSVLVLGAGGIGHAVVTSLEGGIGRVDPFKDMKNRPQGGHGTNLLLVGTDGRDTITEAERKKYRLGGAPCHCTDTIMLVHLSADRQRASVVSLPRDSYAEMPAHTDRTTGKHHESHPVKLNAAYAEGGPTLTVRTVENMTKVKIDHYLEVDFTSFMKTVDAVGGVKICTARPMKDSYTGLNLPAGSHELDGGRALQYVRSRHVDVGSDLGRMQRQQKFLAALIKQVTSSGVLLNPVKFQQVSASALGSVRADEGFGTEQMLALGKAMKGFGPASSEFASVPVGNPSFPVKGIGSTVRWDAAKAKKLFQALREDKPLAPAEPKPAAGPKEPAATLVDVAPEQVRVQVYNGTPKDGLGRTVDQALRATGFATTEAPLNGEARELKRTLVEYDPRWDRSAKSLAAALPGSELKAVKGQGPQLKVTVGSDFTEVRRVRAESRQAGEFSTVRGDEVVCP